MAEQGVHEQVLVQGAAVDGEERALGAVADRVDGLGGEFLAGAGLADDEHVGQHPRRLVDVLAQAGHRAAAADNAVERHGQQLRIEAGAAADLPVQVHRLAHAVVLVEPFAQQGVGPRHLQADEEDVDGFLELADLREQRAEGHGRGVVAGGADFHRLGELVERPADPPAHEVHDRHHQHRTRGEAEGQGAGHLVGGGHEHEAGVDAADAAEDALGFVALGKNQGHVAEIQGPVRGGGRHERPGDEHLSGSRRLHVGDHGPVEITAEIRAEGGAEPGPADIALQTDAEKFHRQFGLPVFGRFGLEHEPAGGVEKKALLLLALLREQVQGRLFRVVHRDDIAQTAQIHTQGELSPVFFFFGIHRRGQADHMHGHGPHPALGRHRRVDDLGGVAEMDEPRRFAGHLVAAGKNAEPVAQGLFQRYRHQGRAGVDEHKALLRGLALEGHLAVAVPLLRGHGAQVGEDRLHAQRPPRQVLELVTGSVQQLVDFMGLGQGAHLGVARVGLVEKRGRHLVGDHRGYGQHQDHHRGTEQEQKLADAPGIDRTVDPNHRVDQRGVGIAHATLSLHSFSRKLTGPVFPYPIPRKSSTVSLSTPCRSIKKIIARLLARKLEEAGQLFPGNQAGHCPLPERQQRSGRPASPTAAPGPE